MQNVSVVEACAGDQQTIFELYELLFRPHVEKIWGWNQEWQEKNFSSEWIEFETHKILLNNQLIGYFQIGDHSDHVFLLNFGLTPNFQSKGIGSHIIKCLKTRAESSSKEMRLGIFKTNKRAIPFYRRHGFTFREKTETGEVYSWKPN